jgi:uncharacterized protein
MPDATSGQHKTAGNCPDFAASSKQNGAVPLTEAIVFCPLNKPTVAILGASADRRKFGNKALRAHQRAGYEVFAVNPKGGQIEGLPVYLRLADVPPAHLDRVSVYLPPPATRAALDEIAGKGCDELWLNPGTSSPEVLQRARALGLNPIEGCSIVELGMSPSEFADS